MEITRRLRGGGMGGGGVQIHNEACNEVLKVKRAIKERDGAWKKREGG